MNSKDQMDKAIDILAFLADNDFGVYGCAVCGSSRQTYHLTTIRKETTPQTFIRAVELFGNPVNITDKDNTMVGIFHEAEFSLDGAELSLLFDDQATFALASRVW